MSLHRGNRVGRTPLGIILKSSNKSSCTGPRVTDLEVVPSPRISTLDFHNTLVLGPPQSQGWTWVSAGLGTGPTHPPPRTTRGPVGTFMR